MPGQFRGLYLLTTLVTYFIKKRRALINIQPQKRGSASRIHQHQSKNGGPPLGTISMDLAVLDFQLYNLKNRV